MKKEACVIVMMSAVGIAAAEGLPLRAMSFNIRYGTALDGPNAWMHRKTILIDTIKQCDPDILGVQECLDFQAVYIAQELPAYRWIGIGCDTDGSGEMVAIFYKKKRLVPIESGNFWLSEHPEAPGSVSWDSSLTRMATWVKFHAPEAGRFFYAFNTHFDHRGAEARRQSAVLLAERIERFGADCPVILMGDFNARAGQSAPWDVLTASGLVDAWVAAEQREGPADTFGGWKAPDPKADARIDWILCRGPITVQRCATVTHNEDGRYPSDHLPVLAELTLK